MRACYAPNLTITLTQAIGLVNHHSVDCCAFLRNEREVAALLQWRQQGKAVVDWRR